MLLTTDLIDEMRITYIPVILGKGIPLFPEQTTESTWKLEENISYDVSILRVKYIKESNSLK